MKKIIVRFAVASLAFSLGLSIFYGLYWFQNFLDSKKLTTTQTSAEKQTTQIPLIEIPDEMTKTEITPSFEDGGYYYIIGKQPEKFSDFREFNIELQNYDEKDSEKIAIIPTGHLFANKEMKFKRLFVGQQYVSFVTEAINGISYQFSGKLVDKIDKFEAEPVYLEGNLKKLKNGKIIAEEKFRFSWFSEHICSQ